MEEELYNGFEQKAKVADEYDLPQLNELAWKKMNAKLDADQPRKRRWLLLWWLPLVIGGGWIGFLLLNGNEVARKNNKVVSVRNEKQLNTQTHRSNKGDANQPSLVQKSSFDSIAFPQNNPLKQLPAVQTDAKTASAKSSFSSTAELNSSRVEITQVPAAERNLDDNNSSFFSKIEHLDRPSQLDKILNLSKETAMQPPAFQFINLTKTEQDSLQPKRKNRSSSKFFVYAEGASVLSKVASNKAGDLSFSSGIGVGYLLSKKWFITGGVGVGKALYKADGDAYKTGNTYGSKLKSVDANCTIMEIPLALGYHFVQKNKIQLFAAAGLSSQIMKRENYEYTSEYYGVLTKGNWNFRNRNSHTLSTATLSVGGSYRAGKNVSIKAAPFYKQSLKGIGEGEVRLNSYGAAIGVHYHF